MRNAPTDSTDSYESLCAQYERLLSDTFQTQSRYDELELEINRAWDVAAEVGVNTAEIERLETESEQLHRTIQRLLSERVALLRQIEKPKTIEDAFPAVRRAAAGEQRADDANSVGAIFTGDTAPDKPPRTNQDIEATWSNDEWKAYDKACEQLAREHGYRVDVGRIMWSKGGLRFHPTLYPLPSTNGMGRNSRVGRLNVHRGKKNVVYYDRGDWDVLPKDADTQRAVDRFVAIFG
jgi:hypothetical protein